MTEPILRPFQAIDVLRIVNRDGVQCSAQELLWQAKQGPTFTAELAGVPIGCAGVVLPWPGVGQCWMVLSTAIEPHTFWMYKQVRKILDRMVEMHHLHRLEAMSITGDARNQRWLEGLGFTIEQQGVARQALPTKQSMTRYEWIRED